MSAIQLSELQGAEAKEALAATKLDIQIAGEWEDNKDVFLLWAAHGKQRTVVVIKNIDNARCVFELRGGTKDERKSRVNNLRARMGIPEQ